MKKGNQPLEFGEKTEKAQRPPKEVLGAKGSKTKIPLMGQAFTFKITWGVYFQRMKTEGKET